MAAVVDDCIRGKLPNDYIFQFAIGKSKNKSAVNENVLSSIVTRKGDRWQLELKRINEEGKSDDVEAKLRLIRSNSKWKFARIGDYYGSEDDLACRAPTAFTIGGEFDVWTPSIDGYDSDDESDLIFHLEVLKCPEATPNPKRIVQIPKSTLPTEVLKWFGSENFGDVTIVAEDGKKLRCHRDILSARSEVFRLMFNSKMKEEREKIVQIEDFNGEIIASLLAFVYADSVDQIGSIADRLCAAAHRYELVRLKNLCETVLADNLSEVVLKTDQFAELYHLDNLKAKCGEYLDKHSGETSTAPKLAKAQRSTVVEAMGWRITSRTDGREDPAFPLDYTFEFVINNACELGKVMLSNYFSHNGDVWQLEVERVGDKDVRCQLHLVETKSGNPKIACVEFVMYKSKSDDSGSGKKSVTKRTPVSLFQHSDDSFDFGTLTVRFKHGNAKLKVQVVDWDSAKNPVEPEPSKSQLINEVLSWFQREDFGDTTVVAADGKKFRCHQDILAHRSEGFRQKFKSLKEEERDKIVNIDDFSGEIVASLLAFVYTDECGDIGPIANDLYLAAHHYQLDRLKRLCESSITASLSPDTWVKDYRMAKDYHLDQLKAKCVEYLDVHKAELPVGKLFTEAMKMEEEEPKAKRIKSD